MALTKYKIVLEWFNVIVISVLLFCNKTFAILKHRRPIFAAETNRREIRVSPQTIVSFKKEEDNDTF